MYHTLCGLVKTPAFSSFCVRSLGINSTYLPKIGKRLSLNFVPNTREGSELIYGATFCHQSRFHCLLYSSKSFYGRGSLASRSRHIVPRRQSLHLGRSRWTHLNHWSNQRLRWWTTDRTWSWHYWLCPGTPGTRLRQSCSRCWCHWASLLLLWVIRYYCRTSHVGNHSWGVINWNWVRPSFVGHRSRTRSD